MKKIIAILLSILLVLSVTGCQGSREVPQEETNEITLTTLASSMAESSALQEMAEQYEAETGIKVNIDVTHYHDEADFAAYQQRVNTELMAKEGADIYSLYFLDYNALGEQGLLYNLAQMMEDDEYFNEEQVYLKVLKAFYNNEQLYGLPVNFNMGGMFATTEEAAEAAREKGVYTWEEFIDIAKELKVSNLAININDSVMYRYWIMDCWEELIDENNIEEPLNTEELGKILEQIKEWREEGYCYNLYDQNLALSNEEYVYTAGPLFTNFLLIAQDERLIEKNRTEFRYLIPMPSETGVVRSEINSMDLYGINANSHHREEAMAFIKFMMQNTVDTENSYTLDRKETNRRLQKTAEELTKEMEGTVDKETIIAGAEKHLDEMEVVQMRNPQLVDCIINGEEVSNFLQGTMPLDEALQSIEEKMILVLQERK